MEHELIEVGLSERLDELSAVHKVKYGSEAALIVRSPGRAEIIGNHVDYCGGTVVAGAIKQSCLVAVSPKIETVVSVWSVGYGDEIVSTALSDIHTEKLKHLLKGDQSWVNYVNSVLNVLHTNGVMFGGLDISIASTVPSQGGVSSSAALELGVAVAVAALTEADLDNQTLADWCQLAENNIGSNCGLLDQYAVALSEPGHLLALDFSDNSSFTQMADLGDNSFLVVFDPNLRRNLGETAYSERRSACETGLAAINKVGGNTYSSLREVAVEELISLEGALAGELMASGHTSSTVMKRLRHVVGEISRTLEAIEFLRSSDVDSFAELMTDSGYSALDNYDLDENTPELRFALEELRKIEGVLGARNMGGGFSVVLLALVGRQSQEVVKEAIQKIYKDRYFRELDFLEFEPSLGASVVQSN